RPPRAARPAVLPGEYQRRPGGPGRGYRPHRGGPGRDEPRPALTTPGRQRRGLAATGASEREAAWQSAGTTTWTPSSWPPGATWSRSWPTSPRRCWAWSGSAAPTASTTSAPPRCRRCASAPGSTAGPASRRSRYGCSPTTSWPISCSGSARPVTETAGPVRDGRLPEPVIHLAVARHAVARPTATALVSAGQPIGYGVLEAAARAYAAQ